MFKAHDSLRPNRQPTPGTRLPATGLREIWLRATWLPAAWLPATGLRATWLPAAWLRATCLLAIVLLLTGCGGSDRDSSATGANGQPAGDQAAGQQQRPAEPPIPVAVQTATTGAIASYYEATASLEAEKQAEVLARVTGVVHSLACEEGDLVEAGAPLLRIDNDEYRLRLRQAEANTANLKARFDRLTAMLAENLVTEEEHQAARSELANAEAEEGLARLNVSYMTVTAPFGGRVVERLVDVGQNVSNGTPLFILADFEPLLAKVHVPSKEFRRLKPEQPVQLTLDSSRQALSGHIKLISPVIDPESGTIKVTVEIPDYSAGTRPGDFAAVRIVTERREGVTLVPKIAVLSEKGEDVVYVAVAGQAERRVVDVGFVDHQNAEIISGIQAGEPVVVKGQRSLKHGAPIKLLEGAPAGAAQSDTTARGEGA